VRREEQLGPHIPEPIVTREQAHNPEQQALLAEAVGYALLVVLDTLAPAERLTFVLHDIFGMPFDEIAPMIGRSSAAARQLASRARRRVRLAAPAPDADYSRQRAVVDAFLAAARDGNFEALLALLAPDVVVRVTGPLASRGAAQSVQGSSAVTKEALRFARLAEQARPVLVNGTAGFVVAPRGQPFAVLAFTITNGVIVAIDILTDPERLRCVTLPDPSYDDPIA
jgi:RNA polymerase sigma-70 factor (ECF subfamily)